MKIAGHIIRTTFLALFVATAGFAAPGLAQSSKGSAKDALTPAQREAVEAIVGDVIREHPEIVLDAIRTLQERQQAQEQQTNRAAFARYQDEIEHDPTSPVAGNPDGDVTVVEFFDYRCTYCKKVFPSIVTLLASDKNVRYVFKEFPILSPESEIGARAALAVWQHAPDLYFAFHSHLMALRGDLTKARVLSLADGLGIDPGSIEADMGSEKFSEVIRRNHVLADALGIRGTPGFVINGKIVPGAIGLDELRRMIAAARKG